MILRVFISVILGLFIGALFFNSINRIINV